MANKYEEFSRKQNAKVGEIGWTYGVNFIHSPEVKPHRHSQNRPYLVLYREESGNFKALKLTTQIGGYMTEFKLPLEKYGLKSNVRKGTIADLRQLIPVKPTEITKTGLTPEFVLDREDLSQIYAKIIRLYSLNATLLNDEEIRKIFERYIRNFKPQLGTILIVNFCKNYLFVIGCDEENYECIPIHRERNTPEDETIDIYREPSYVNYEERYYIPKDSIYFVKSYIASDAIIKQVLQKIGKKYRPKSNYSKNSQQNNHKLVKKNN